MENKQDVKKEPTLRFSEFDVEWIGDRLDMIFSIFNGYAFSSEDAQNSGCRWVKIADVGINEMKDDAISFLPIDYRNKHEKFVLRDGDFVIALTRPILSGELKIARINKNFDGALLNQRVGKLTSTNVNEYVYYLLQRSSIIGRIENRIAGTDPPNLSPYEIGSLKTYIPSIPEQKKIATFLSAVDKKIQQLTRKKELLEQYKKGVMQKLFSQEIRFKDENGKDYPDWEKRSFGERVSKSKAKHNPQHSDMGYPCIELESIASNQGNLLKVFDVNEQKSIKNKFDCGDVLLGKLRPNLRKFLYTSFKGVCSSEIWVLKGINLINKYLFYLVQTSKFYRISNITFGSKMPRADWEFISSFPFRFPSKEEQSKIANFLSSLDDKIFTMQTQITQTQKFKKGLLQQMFV